MQVSRYLCITFKMQVNNYILTILYYGNAKDQLRTIQKEYMDR